MNKKTTTLVAKKAAKTLSKPETSKVTKSLAGSVLSQTNSTKKTSATVSKTASKTLQDNRSSVIAKTLAGSLLSQTRSPTGKTTVTAQKGTSSGGPRKRK